MQVSELMTPNPKTLDVTATVRDAIVLLNDLDVRHLPVMDGSDLVGIISDRDVKAALGADGQDAEALANELDASVGHLMSADVLTVGPEDDVGEAIDLMLENRLGSLPVVTDDPQELVGIVSYVDILRAARSLL